MKKTIGSSDILVWAPKEVCNEIYSQFSFSFNEYLEKKTIFVPICLKKRLLHQCKKNDDPQLTKNYVSNSITGALSKVFKKILHKQINEYLTS